MKRILPILMVGTLGYITACQPPQTQQKEVVKEITVMPDLTPQEIRTDKAPLPVGPYSQAIKVGNTLYLAGQIGRDPVSGEMQSESLATEVRQVMANLQAVLKAAGSDFDHVVQTTVYLNDLNDFTEMNQIYATYFKQAPPARATVEVSNLARNARLEIAMIAVIPSK